MNLNQHLKALSLVLAACALFACSADNKDDSRNSLNTLQADELKIRLVYWEDLMPEGEDVVLEKLYEEYYQNLEKEYAAIAEQRENTANSDSSSDNSGENPFDLSNIIEGAANDTMDQIGTFNVVESLDGELIRIPGYVVPLDFDAQSKYTEFLLVPYFGACLHTPPPPPNQILFVTSATPALVPSIYDPVWVEGTLKTGEFSSDLANTAYELTLSKVEPYEY